MKEIVFGKNFKVKIEGKQSLGSIKVSIDGIPEGTVIDYNQLSRFMERRLTCEEFPSVADEKMGEIYWEKGVANFGGELGIVTDVQVTASFDNPMQSDEEVQELKRYTEVPRPSAPDFTAVMKNGKNVDLSACGSFSDRMTIGLCIAGGIAKQLLAQKKIEVLSDIAEIGGSNNQFAFEDMVESTAVDEDSLGGVVECAVMGLEAGSCGDSYDKSLRAKLANAVFSLPGITGIEFGSGFAGAKMSGSENNDAFTFDADGAVRTVTNNHGGILGGIASGMPVVMRVAVSPSALIGKEQTSINLETGKREYLTINNNTEVCNVPFTAASIEAAAAITVLDALMEEERPYGLLGRKLSHSFSPEIHKEISEAAGNPYNYVLFEREPEELEDFLRGNEWEGLNVTVPYKETVMKYLDEISDEAEAIGAVNTIVRRNGKLAGFNTDYFGFMQTLDNAGADVAGAKCLVLGDGGASKAVQQALRDLNAGEITVMSRKGDITFADMGDHKDAEILINTTPVGMFPDTMKSLAYPGSFPKLKNVIDIIYNPLRTNMLCQAEKALIPSASGLDMLVSQAMYSAMLFMDEVVEDKDRIIEKIVSKLRTEKQNIVLIGMPGAGKTTAGEYIAEKLGREFYDTDDMIVARDGRMITEIFEAEGEEYFRDLESAACMELNHDTGLVIACGGGVIKREENYYALAENSFIVFLNSNYSGLATEGRPISLSVPAERLYKERLPLYRSWCDCEIDTEGLSLEETAAKVIEAFQKGFSK